ncbi:RICIN domain-containing protein [Streptomyces palmae]|uniref:Ricin B lectin domain-containing protein n=1 Tax=Streptomyces palmae TaxID=1701085 RepID=A0A4Z0HBQ9_9ACTN|nr:RICIN domain-containing protein [Streptomyces palmae]TGB16690.1 hypothetical protein E4099_04865 [Streptomyces palmae]
MSRIAKTFVAMAVVALSTATAPAFGASTASSLPTPQKDPGATVQRLTPTEMADLKSRAPEKFERMVNMVSKSRESSRAGASGLASTDEPTVYRLLNEASGKCLAIGSSSTEDGAHAIQWHCLNTYGQLWFSDDDNHIINFNSGKLLAIGSSSMENGAHAIQWDYTGSDGQRWYFDTHNHIINGNSAKFLAIGSSSTEDGAHAIQWDETGSAGQRWL